MKIRLPRGRELDGRALAEFKRQREQIDGLMEKATRTRASPSAPKPARAPSQSGSSRRIMRRTRTSQPDRLRPAGTGR